MYVRPQGYRYAEGIRLPKNYGGSTFREPMEEAAKPQPAPLTEEPAPTEPVTLPEDKEPEPKAASALLGNGKTSLPFGLGNIGSEELLILALILLLSDSDIGDDLILLLVLLFFIK